jgi:hypothetical protein
MRIFDFAFREISAFDRNKIEQTRWSPATFVTNMNSDALDVAGAIDSNRSKVVLVVDSNDAICGVIGPTFLRDQLCGYLGLRPTTLSDAVSGLLDSGRPLPDSLPANRPRLVHCPIHNHMVEPPCTLP